MFSKMVTVRWKAFVLFLFQVFGNNSFRWHGSPSQNSNISNDTRPVLLQDQVACTIASYTAYYHSREHFVQCIQMYCSEQCLFTKPRRSTTTAPQTVHHSASRKDLTSPNLQTKEPMPPPNRASEGRPAPRFDLPLRRCTPYRQEVA